MVSNTDFHKEIDAYFERQQVVFNAHFRRLVGMRSTLMDLDRSMSSTAHQLDDLGQVKWQGASLGTLDAILTEFDWSFKYDIQHCGQLLYLLCLRTESAIYRELARMYEVRVLHENRLTEAYFNRKVWNGIEPDLTVVKDSFLALFGDRSLMDQQLLDLRAYLRNWLYMKPMGWNGSVITLQRIFCVSSWTLRMQLEDRKLLRNVMRLLQYYLKGTLHLSDLATENQLAGFCERVRKTVALEVGSPVFNRLEIDDIGNFTLVFATEESAAGFWSLLQDIVSAPMVNLDF